MNPHEEEFQAEVRCYLLWCEGRLEELREAGVFSGDPVVTERGMIAYRKLDESGFRPTKEKLLRTLRSLQRFQESDLEVIVTMMEKTQ